MSIVWSGLAPHPPIIVAAVGGPRCSEVSQTIDHMNAWAQDLLKSNPNLVVLVSPHTPRVSRGIAFFQQNRGSFSQFGAPQARVDLPAAASWCTRFADHFKPTLPMAHDLLDHGAMVPLHFLQEAGWRGKTAVLGLPIDASQCDALGSAIATASQGPERVALIASGDMSHCLKPGAPCGFAPQGLQFDQAFVDQISQNQFQQALALDPNLQEAAKQDVVESCRTVWQATNFNHNNAHFYGYEGPFGVGYTVMRFHKEAA